MRLRQRTYIAGLSLQKMLVLRRRPSTRSMSSGVDSASTSQDYSFGDMSASQQSLGEEGTCALVALNEMGVEDTEEDNDESTKPIELTTTQKTRASPRLSPKTSTSKETASMPSLVVEGIVVRDTNGAFFTPQKYVFTYCSNSPSHARQVNKVLSDMLAKYNAIPECYANRFKCSPIDYDGLLPSVVGGLTSKYKNKIYPSTDEGAVAKAEDEAPRRRKRTRRH